MMKKTVSVLLALLLVMTLTVAMAETVKYVSTANGGILNMRAEPKSGSKILTTIPYAGAVTLVADAGDGWSEVTVTGYAGTGFVQSKFLSDKKPTPYTGETLQVGKVYNSIHSLTMDRWYQATVQTLRGGAEVSLRWSPTSNGTVMKKIPVGEIVTVIAEGTEWWQVLDETTGQVGFMPGKYLVPVPQTTVTADANAE